MKKFCTKCGHEFEATGREVICPSCKAQAAEDAKRAAVLKAKRASWNGESVPVRISGRASTLIREYSAANGLPFAAALDALLKASAFFKNTGKADADSVTRYSRVFQECMISARSENVTANQIIVGENVNIMYAKMGPVKM